jgi:hypothetical protein
MTRGQLYHQANYYFKNSGLTSPKFLVCLSDESTSPERMLVCYATSKQGKKTNNPGCDKQKTVFHMRAGGEFFPSDTWLELGQASLMERTLLEGLVKKKDVEKLEEKLSKELVENIISCYRNSHDFDPNHEPYLK